MMDYMAVMKSGLSSQLESESAVGIAHNIFVIATGVHETQLDQSRPLGWQLEGSNVFREAGHIRRLGIEGANSCHLRN